jgi:hypothetical protein
MITPTLKLLIKMSAVSISLVWVLSGSPVNGVDFVEDVVPLLEAKCMRCHNPNSFEGDFSMATLAEIQAVGDDFLVPGHAEDSMLYWITLPLDGEAPEMPEEGEPLSKEETAILAAWINEGAEWPEEVVLKEPSKADENWWSFQPVSKPELDFIDAFIGAEGRRIGDES